MVNTTRRTPDGKRTPELRAYDNMMQRCYNPNYVKSRNYSERGITVCDRWRGHFANFYEDMGKRPHGMSLDRIDNNKGYSKENCRWADIFTQKANRRMLSKGRGKLFTNSYTGINKINYGYTSRIVVRGKCINAGTYPTLDEAISARLHIESIYL